MNLQIDEKLQKANNNIVSLIGEIVVVKKNEDKGYCPYSKYVRKDSENKDCDECHEEYYYDYEEKLVEENYID